MDKRWQIEVQVKLAIIISNSTKCEWNSCFTKEFSAALNSVHGVDSHFEKCSPLGQICITIIYQKDTTLLLTVERFNSRSVSLSLW